MANILIVDDERPIRRILSMLLQEKRHRVADVGSGEEALAVFPNLKPDLVLLDLKLPGMDGLDTLKRLRAKADGVSGPATRVAIREFEKSVGLRETGEPSREVYVALIKALTPAAGDPVTRSPLPPPRSEPTKRLPFHAGKRSPV